MRYKVMQNTITNFSVDFNQSQTSDEGDIGFSRERGIHESGSEFFSSGICQ